MGKTLVLMVIVSNLLLASEGMVKKLKGKAEVERGKQVIVLKVGSRLQSSDTILTKPKSSVGITFDDGSRLALGSGTTLLINKFEFDPNKKKYDIDLDLKKGKAVFSSGKVGELAPESVKFRIPEGIIGIRGTKFAVEVK
ncbi:MAG: Unknown protein [uncultured Sulfurovum sp.]|uniref:FecR protein domain-containing protein n=1 Tax=uncultured Sulfurovum sp. TaxID=269237 RepID=A0A6S6TTG1_9BACT|nr:MAG: Unknown protein [uncultured Sulfurovum sp.]